jgi:hypothetical protein
MGRDITELEPAANMPIKLSMISPRSAVGSDMEKSRRRGRRNVID